MDDVNEKLNALLSDPGSMAQIMQLAQQLSGSMGGDTGAAAARVSGGFSLAPAAGATGRPRPADHYQIPAAPTGADPRHQPNHPTSLRPAAVSEGRQTE